MKDLTNIVEYSKKLEESGETPRSAEGISEAFLEEPRVEKIDNFESLEEYSKTNPPAEPSLEIQLKVENESPEITASPAEEAIPGFEGEIPGLSDGMPAESASPEPANSEAPLDMGGLVSDVPASFEPAPAAPEAEFVEAQPLAAPIKTSVEKIKQYSERITAGRPAVQAAFPFSLLITGPLTVSEREKLIDLIARENMGIREVDLEPQLEAGRILIPRISEYAGVLLVQALRGTRAKMKLGPSDSIFSTEATRDTEEDQISASVTPPGGAGRSSSDQAEVTLASDLVSPAESIPVTPLPTLPDHAGFSVVDAVTASATIKTSVVEAESSVEYQEVLEALQRELKYKAYRKGANAIVNFSVTLTSLTLASHYRLSVVGSAVKATK